MLPILGLAVTPHVDLGAGLAVADGLGLAGGTETFRKAQPCGAAVSVGVFQRADPALNLVVAPPRNASLRRCAAVTGRSHLAFRRGNLCHRDILRDGLHQRRPTDRPLPPRVRAEALPTVDILVPSYNEPIDMLSSRCRRPRTSTKPAEKAARLCLCDDGGTDERCAQCRSNSFSKLPATAARRLQKGLCAELGVRYAHAAPATERAKAGNMSAALDHARRRVGGSLRCRIMCPAPTFSPGQSDISWPIRVCFLCRHPTSFHQSQTRVQRNLELDPRCPAENEMFYSGDPSWPGSLGWCVLLRLCRDPASGRA